MFPYITANTQKEKIITRPSVVLVKKHDIPQRHKDRNIVFYYIVDYQPINAHRGQKQPDNFGEIFDGKG